MMKTTPAVRFRKNANASALCVRLRRAVTAVLQNESCPPGRPPRRNTGSPQRFYSMSAQIRAERRAYYAVLEATQKGDLDITDWLEWFLACLDRAFDGAEIVLAALLTKARFWEKYNSAPLNERQRAMLNRLLDGFAGKLTSSKWAKITKCSQDTALRDIAGLVARGILVKDAGGGRSTSYSLGELG